MAVPENVTPTAHPVLRPQTADPVPRPQRADARRNRARILEAAHAEFARSGGETQMDAVATRAGVGVGTVYRHFPTKDILVTELIRDRFESFVSHADAALEVADPWEAFAGFMRANAAQCAADRGTQHLFLQAADPTAGPRLAAETGLTARAQELIDRGQAAGVIRPDFSAEDIGMVMCGVASAMHFGAPDWDWRRHLGFVLDGLRAHPR